MTLLQGSASSDGNAELIAYIMQQFATQFEQQLRTVVAAVPVDEVRDIADEVWTRVMGQQPESAPAGDSAGDSSYSDVEDDNMSCLSDDSSSGSSDSEYDGDTETREDGRVVREGEGTLHRKDGTVLYSGEWADNQYCGEGVEYWLDGETEKYNGEWLDGERHGIGSLYRKDGTLEYHGESNFGEFHGDGVEYHDDGETPKYDGPWAKGLRHCEPDADGVQADGKEYNKLGKLLYDGPWLHGKRHGENGALYRGANSDDEDICVYNGDWRDGERCGSGASWYAPVNGQKQMEYTGKWAHDKRHGRGTSYLRNGKVEHDGFWEQGVFVGQMR